MREPRTIVAVTAASEKGPVQGDRMRFLTATRSLDHMDLSYRAYLEGGSATGTTLVDPRSIEPYALGGFKSDPGEGHA